MHGVHIERRDPGSSSVFAESASMHKTHTYPAPDGTATEFSRLLAEPPILSSEVVGSQLGHVRKMHGLLSNQECQRLIDASESMEYAELSFNGGATLRRNNTRLIVHDPALAAVLWDRLVPILDALLVVDPESGIHWRPTKINPRFRFCRYHPGQFFVTHCDGAAVFGRQEVTAYTVNIYLNGGFTGGRTVFYLDPAKPTTPTFVVHPEAGMCTLFNHATESLPHEAEVLQTGVKYILRTDVIVQPTLEQPKEEDRARWPPFSRY